MLVLYTDFDGVLNDHTKLESGYCGTSYECVRRFNRILDEIPELKIVVSSAWRYLTFRGEMTVKGLEMLLLTHGVKAFERVIGVTPADPEPEPGHFDDEAWRVRGLKWRRDQIVNHAKFHGWERRYVAVDDLELDLDEAVFVRTDGTKGLSWEDSLDIVSKLRAIQLSGVPFAVE